MYTFSLSGNCADAESITFRVDTATDSVEHTEAFTLGTNQIISSENFDSTPIGQIPTGYSRSSGSAAANWRTTAASAASASNSVFASDHTAVNSAYLTSPEITVSNKSRKVELRFDHNYHLHEQIDGGLLEISINGGTWTEWMTAGGTFVQNGYDIQVVSVFENPVGGQFAWSGNSQGFIQTIANFPPSAVGQTVRVRWHLGSDNCARCSQTEGWWIDNIEVRDYMCCETIELVELDVIQLTDFIITNEACSPANGSPDPDERITGSITLANIGSENATNVSITLSGSSDLSDTRQCDSKHWHTHSGANDGCGLLLLSIRQLRRGRKTSPFRVDTATGFSERVEAFILGANKTILLEDFDSTPLGQIPAGYSQSSGIASANWGTTATSSASAPNSVFSPGYTAEDSAYFISPDITVSQNSVELRFDHDYNLVRRLDGGNLEISINSGTWTEWTAAGGSFATKWLQ